MALDNEFMIRGKCDLVRIGQNNDGGYLICNKSVLETKYLVSIGISDDFSFEENFLKIRNEKINIRCYDDVLNEFFLFKKLIISFLRAIHKKDFKIFKSQIIKTANYIKLKKKIIFNKKKIQRGDLDNILKNINNDKIYLKIDIEGAEYNLLDEILKNQKKLHGLIIEFHNCNLNKNKIKDFISKFEIPLVHIHGNNFAPLDNEQNPTVLEITFDKCSKSFDGKIELPNKLDMPNNPNQNEIFIKYKNFN